MKPIRIVLAPTRSRPLNIFLGMTLALVSLLLLLSLVSYHASDPSLNSATDSSVVRNWIGPVGAYASDLLLQALGLAAFLIPLWLGSLGWTWMRSRPSGSPVLRWIGSLLALTFVPAVLGLMPWHWRWLHVMPIEGVAGRLAANQLVIYLNLQGAWVVAAVLAAGGLYFASPISFAEIRENLAARWESYSYWRERRRAEREELRDEQLINRDEDSATPAGQPPRFSQFAGPGFEPEPPVGRSNRLLAFFGLKRAQRKTPLDEIPAYRRTDQLIDDQLPDDRLPDDRAEDEIPITSRTPSIWERSVAATAAPAAASVAATAATASVAAARPASAPQPVAPAAPPRSPEIAISNRPAPVPPPPAVVAPKAASGGFKLPPTSLLIASEGPQDVRKDELREDARILVEKCAEFDVRGQVVQINPGPLVTTFEFKPEAGIKYSRVTSLAEDLCLAMRAESILIERIPGKSTVGIQVPNRVRETIHVRELLESESFQKAKSRLTLALGKDINGYRVVTTDLASLPHVLIAGSTGSGKSVSINAMIMSLLYRTTPDQVRLILVDPKRVELGMYEGIPHLFTPIITEPKLAANALRNAVREMERRLKLLASRSVRNLEQYNRRFENATGSLFDDGEEDEGPLPYIVIIIDELADLMMLDRANVEESITRLAQMARAVGIHLILATQRPSVDVITGLIKANIPTRISFRLATKVDSRTILDTNGAESLLGRGDMLFLPPGTSRLTRLHAPLVTEQEISAVVAFWKAQGEAEYVHSFLESPAEDPASDDGAASEAGDDDPLFDDAVRLIFEFGKASTSLLQRRLRIGYGRAAHLIDMMERDGLVCPADGSRPRELLKSPAWYHEAMAAND